LFAAIIKGQLSLRTSFFVLFSLWRRRGTSAEFVGLRGAMENKTHEPAQIWQQSETLSIIAMQVEQLKDHSQPKQSWRKNN
jgi:hypothetical protein